MKKKGSFFFFLKKRRVVRERGWGSSFFSRPLFFGGLYVYIEAYYGNGWVGKEGEGGGGVGLSGWVVVK